jgi:hypothetical protein
VEIDGERKFPESPFDGDFPQTCDARLEFAARVSQQIFNSSRKYFGPLIDYCQKDMRVQQ